MPTLAADTYESSRFGVLEVAPDAVLVFPRGLIGIGGTRYALVGNEPDAPFAWLQSLEDPELALPVTSPWRFFPDFAVELSDAETQRLALPAGATPDVWVTVRATAAAADCTANLRAPILVHDGVAHQVFNEAPGAVVRAPLFPAGAPSTA